MKKNLFGIITVVLMLGMANLLLSQNKQGHEVRTLEYNNTFFTNTIVFPDSIGDSLQIVFSYSILYDGLVFQKTGSGTFFAVPEVEAIFKDSTGITRKRFISNDTIFVNTYEQTQSKIKYYTNFTQFALAKTDYKVTSKLNNSKSINNFPIETRINNTKQCYAPIFLQLANNEESIFSPFMLSESISFVAPKFSVFIPIVDTTINGKCNYTINKNPVNSGYDWGKFIDITGECSIVKGISFLTNSKNSEIQLKQVHNINGNNFLSFDVSMDTFIPGKYTLTITNNSNVNTEPELKFNFEVYWFNMPMSITNIDFAAEQMHLILTDEEFELMKDDSKENIFSNVLNYWKNNDPTPFTKYNEAMTEFFHRVDYAENNFKTLTQKEGAKSDRGKVFILNGAPDKITNEAKDKSNFETWYYNKPKTTYVFEIVSVGNYKLINLLNN